MQTKVIQNNQVYLFHDYWDQFIWDHLFETTFILDLFLSGHLIWDFFVWDHVESRPDSFEITFILHHIEVKLFWLTMYHIFMIYHPLLHGRPEVLQGDSSFKVLQGYDLLCPRWLTLGFKSTHILNIPQRPENSMYHGFGKDCCTSELSFC